MNINELFFFKVFQCDKDGSNEFNHRFHNEKNCYFYHTSNTYENGNMKIIEKDRRREPISFAKFFKRILNKLKDDENYGISLETIFEFKNDENNFHYYLDSMPFDFFNEYIYLNADCCKNATEFNYHINRYKTNKCRYLKINKKCNNTFCYGKHVLQKNEFGRNEIDKENFDINTKIINADRINYGDDLHEGIIEFRNKINKWREKKEIQFVEIIDLYNYILSFDNKYLSKIQIDEIKKSFNLFQKWYKDFKARTQYEDKNKSKANPISNEDSFEKIYDFGENERSINYQVLKKYQTDEDIDPSEIIKDIFKSIKMKKNDSKIYKNSNLIETLKINTNVCYISKYTSIKKQEIVKYVYAMLNSSDGVIIYGGHVNNNTIKGISLSRKERDKFKIWFNSEFIKILIEYEDNLKYNFCDLANNTNDECVLIIEIKKIKSNKLLIKYPAKCIIIKEKFLNRNKQEKNKLLSEENVKELNLKEYLEVLRKRLLEHYSEKFKFKIKEN